MTLNSYYSKGITREDYLEKIKKQLNELENSVDEKGYAKYYQMNLKRIDRLDKTFTLTDEQKEQLKQVSHDFRVIVITEGWCGDAAQVEPVMTKIFQELSVEVSYMFRDENPDLMDLYLTDGARSIPIFIGIDSEGNEIFRYGPRPQQGMELLEKHKQNPEDYPADKFHADLQIWYNHDKGQSIYEEFIKLLK